jgi:hypothetical protein
VADVKGTIFLQSQLLSLLSKLGRDRDDSLSLRAEEFRNPFGQIDTQDGAKVTTKFDITKVSASRNQSLANRNFRDNASAVRTEN